LSFVPVLPPPNPGNQNILKLREGYQEMAQAETEKLTRILWSAALSRAVSTIAELGIRTNLFFFATG
jgi:hypothetical protein